VVIDAVQSEMLNDRTDYQHCFVCGQRNDQGLQVNYWLEGSVVVTEFTPQAVHQGYPGFCHGGILVALLDETAGRVAMLDRRWVMTVKLETRFRKPVRIGQFVTIRGEAIRWKGRILKARGEVFLPDGTIAAEAHGLFIRLPKEIGEETAAAFPGFEEFWQPSDTAP